MVPGAVGQDQLSPFKLLDRGAKRGVWLERRVIDLVHEVEEVVGLHAMLGHQPTHRGAVALVIVLLQQERIVVADLEELGDVVADALVDLLPEIDMMRIERVVEIEHPGFDLGEVAGAGAWWCSTHRVTVERLGVPRALYPLPAKRGEGGPNEVRAG